MAEIKKFPTPRNHEEVSSIDEEINEFWDDQELALDQHQRWYLKQIATTAPLLRQRRSARKLLDETIWLFSSKVLGLPPTRQGDENATVTITYKPGQGRAIKHERCSD